MTISSCIRKTGMRCCASVIRISFLHNGGGQVFKHVACEYVLQVHRKNFCGMLGKTIS